MNSKVSNMASLALSLFAIKVTRDAIILMKEDKGRWMKMDEDEGRWMKMNGDG